MGRRGADLNIEELLAFGEDVGDLAYASLEFSHGVICADTDGVFFTNPFHCQSKLLVGDGNHRTAAAAAAGRHFLAATGTSG